MPRRSLDKGSKPFEFRTGIGGLPQLGGMFRSGDPAKIPPHKFHLLANMRRTPGGTITRPGLALEFDTGIQECINGLTEDSGLQGGAIMLYPGAEAGSNPATLRAIFPDSSIDYSEFAVALYGPASAVRGVESPVLAYTTGGSYLGPTWLSRPFIFRGQAVQFALVDRNGTSRVALLGINLGNRSFLQASDCWRNEDGPVGDPSCPGSAGLPAPPGDSPPLWPFQYPVGSVGVLAYLDNPFGVYGGPSGDITDPPIEPGWRPDSARASSDLVIDEIAATPERFDDQLTGTPGVNEVLYFVARRTVLGVVQRKLVRWDGVALTNEVVAIPDDLRVGLSADPGQLALMNFTDAGGFSASRLFGGAWVIGAVTNVGNFVPAGVSFLPRTVTWGGFAHACLYGRYQCSLLSDGPFVFLWRQETDQATVADVVLDISAGVTSCRLLQDFCELTGDVVVSDIVVSSYYCYGIMDISDAPDDGVFLGIGDFKTGDLADPLHPHGWSLGNASPLPWIQAVGGRVYVGGKFNFNPESELADGTHHGVYDVTTPNAIFNVYRVTEAQQTNDAVAERYSRGALSAVPNDDTGGQGFQAS